MNEPTWEFYIAGVQHHEYKKVIEAIAKEEKVYDGESYGTILELMPEPTNQYDENAIRILYKGIMIGYVPKIHSAVISSMINDPNMNLMKCRIHTFIQEEKPWKMFKVVVYESDVKKYHGPEFEDGPDCEGWEERSKGGECITD